MKHNLQNRAYSTIIVTLFFNLLFFHNNILYSTDIPMYPTPEFTKVEKVCKEICSDLDVLNFNRALHNDWVENSEYLFNKFLVLTTAITILVNNKEESRSYLLEDIHYLINTVHLVELSYVNIYGRHIENPLCQSMFILIHQSKEKLHELLLINQEIV